MERAQLLFYMVGGQDDGGADSALARDGMAQARPPPACSPPP